jgi:hypothetical protein
LLQLERKKEEETAANRPAAVPTIEPAARGAATLSEEEEFVIGVADVLAGAGVEGPSKEVVLGVVERLVSRLHLLQREKDSATHQIRGMRLFSMVGFIE